MQRRWASRVAVTAVAVLAVAGGPVAAQEPDHPVEGEAGEPTEPAGQAELAALAQARAAVSAHMGRSASAEGGRRQAEAAVVEAHRAVLVAEQDLEHVGVLIDAALGALDVARAEQLEAQEHFDRGVATSYKLGAAHSSALLLTAIQSATDAHDLARAVDELDNVLGHSYDELEDRTRATALAQARVDALTRLRGVAYLAVQDARAGIAPRVAHLDTARAAARTREAALLDAAARALDAEQAAMDAEADPAAITASGSGDPLAPGTATVDPVTGPTVEQRRDWLGGRRRVVAAQARLPSEAWAVRGELTCPVEDGRFDNDFHFPRSHGRRHLGTDVFADKGTPIVAMAAGEVTKIDASDGFDGDSDLGGVTVSWTTDAGRFYAAHLLRVPPGLAVGDQVEAGDVVGYVGATGNARGGAPHLHLGWYVDGVEINPWPTLAVVCHPDGLE